MEMYHLKKIYNEYKEKDFAIVSIDLYEDPKKVKEFINEIGIEWIVTIDKDGQVTDKYHIQAIPTLILIDPDGIVVDVYVGVTEEKILKDRIEALMLTKTTEITNTTYFTITTHYITITKSETQTLIIHKTELSIITEYATIAQTYTILERINTQWIIWLIAIIFIIVVITIFLKRYKHTFI